MVIIISNSSASPLIADDQNDGNRCYSVHYVLAALQYSDGEYIWSFN